MPLPILQSHVVSDQDLLRLYARAELHWTRHLGEEAQLAVGTAFTNPELDQVYDANRILDVALPPGASPADAMQVVERHYAEQGTACRVWMMNPAAPAGQTEPMAAHLRSLGYQNVVGDIMYLSGTPAGPVQEVGGLTIIPARASFRHTRELGEEAAARWGEPQLVEAKLMHLDDPHYDMLIALEDGRAVAAVGVLAVGEVGAIQHVFVSKTHRRRGIGRTMMSRALEICARSLFKHVLLQVSADNAPAIALYQSLGFRRIGSLVEHHAPGQVTKPVQGDE